MEHDVIQEATELAGQRGPLDHKRRQQILDAAEKHFRVYGYRKTTIADIAKTINLSTAYLYKFFDSKQAIGEAICSQCLSEVLAEIEEATRATRSPVEKLRRVFLGLERNGWRLFNEERKIHDLVQASFEEHWSSLTKFQESRYRIVREIILLGRETGEFERKTPLEETCKAIARTTDLFFHPVLLQQAGEDQSDEALAIANLVVRSLAV